MSEKTETPEDVAARIRREADEKDVSLLVDFVDFLKTSKKWWLIPLLIALAVIGLLATVGGSAIGPFMYPMI